MRKKLEIQEYYATYKTARGSDLQNLTVRKRCKAIPPKKTSKGDSVVSKEVRISRERKKEQEGLYLIR